MELKGGLKILVTGGAGFIGSALVRHLVKNTADEIVNVGNLGSDSDLSSVNKVYPSGRDKFFQIDIWADQLARFFEKSARYNGKILMKEI